MSREALIVLVVTAVLALLIVIGTLEFVVPIVYLMTGAGILDAAIHPDSAWRAADQNKLAWVLVQLFPVVGTLVYVAIIHPKLTAVAPSESPRS